MKTRYYFSWMLALLLIAGNSANADDGLIQRQWTVGGVTREALVYAPATAKADPCPVVFVFHGHGGTMKNMATKFACHKLWPEAIAVYMQGLNTPVPLIDPEGKQSGWQTTFGGQGDRDLKFFDAVLATLKQDYRVDTKRIYATGHSNGGAFTYLLWANYGDLFAAVAPCAAIAKPSLKGHFKPLPVFHMAGTNDTVVKFEWQQLTLDEVKKVNGCGDGTPWSEQHCTLYPSKTDMPLVTYIHSGGHLLPAEVPPIIIKFFKQHTRP